MSPRELTYSLSTACLAPRRLGRILDLAVQAGFGGIELVLGSEAWVLGAQRLRRIVSARGLAIHSVHQALFRYDPSGWVGGRMVAAARTAKALGCSRVVIHGPWTEEWDSLEGERWLAALTRCREIVAGSSTRLALENPGVYSEGDRLNVLAPFEALVAFAEEHDLDLTLDTCHVGADSPSLMKALEAVRPRLANVHLSDLQDAQYGDRALLKSVYAHHQLPGEGRLPLGLFLARLVSSGYGGPVTLEASPFALRARSARQALLRLAEARAFVQESVSPAGATLDRFVRKP